METPTRTAETEQAYRQVFMRLLDRAGRAAGGGDAPLPFDAFIDWLEQERSGLAKRTWWRYKAACVFALTEIQTRSGRDLAATITRLQQLSATPCQPAAPRTSAKKAKRLPQTDLLTLCHYLENTAGRWGVPTARWLLAGHATGLRPIEWTRAERITLDGVAALRVTNAKSTNGRAHGAHRHLLLVGWDDATVALLETHLATIQAAVADGRYETVYANCRNALYRAALICFPDRARKPALYSARHQFAADNKRRYAAARAAALMGHNTDRTVQRQYAQSRHGEPRGQGGLPPLPEVAQGELMRVEVGQAVSALLQHLPGTRQASTDSAPAPIAADPTRRTP